MRVQGENPSQESKSKDALRIFGYTLLGSILAVPAILMVFTFVSMFLYVFLDFNLLTDTALTAMLVYSCLVIPIAIIIISIILLKRKQENFRKVMLLSWTRLIGAGVLLVIILSAIRGERLTDTRTPDLSQEEQVETAVAYMLLEFAATSQHQTETAPTETLTPTAIETATETLTPTVTLTPTASNTPTITPIPAVNINTIYSYYESMTVLQFNNYFESIRNQPVRQKVTIGNVSASGIVQLSGSWSPWLVNIMDFCVIVTGTPSTVALDLDAGQRVFLEATISSIVGNYNYYWNCENTLILTYRDIR